MFALLLVMIAQPVAIEDAISLPWVGNLVASGERVAFTSNDRGRRSVWIADAPGFKARAVFVAKEDDGQELGSIAFSREGAIAFTRGSEVWIADGEARKVADGRDAVFAGEGLWFTADGKLRSVGLDGKAQSNLQISGVISSLVPSPDRSRLAFVSARGDHAFVGVYEIAKKSVLWMAPSVDRDSSPVWSPDGKRVAFIRLPGGSPDRSPVWDAAQRFSIWIAEVETGVGREVFASPDASGPWAQTATERPLQWGAGDRLVFYWERDGWARLHALPIDGEAVAISPPECEAEGAILSADRRTIYFSANCGDRERRDLYTAPIDGVARAMTAGNETEHSPAPLNKYVAFIAASSPRVMIFDLANATATPIELPFSKKSSFAEPEVIAFRAKDGPEVRAQLFLPPEPAARGERRPAVIFVHGGPRRQMLSTWHPMEYYHWTYAVNQALAARGFVVLAVNFRGGTGYGLSFRRTRAFGGAGASELDDLVAAASQLAKRPDVDPARIGIWGGSYGGYLAALALARRSDLFEGGVVISGFFDWMARRDVDGRAALGEGARKSAIAASPITWIDRWRSPVLLIHGDDDRRVPFGNTVELAQRLRGVGKAGVEVLALPDADHGFVRFRDLSKVSSATVEFLERRVARY